jgi:hypothetical protein
MHVGALPMSDLFNGKNKTLYTVGPRYSRTFYLKFSLFTFAKNDQNDNFPVKNELFICELKICGLSVLTKLPHSDK